MKSLTKLTNLATSLSLNTSSTNSLLMQQLINDQHRYLIQKFFDNERTSTTTTIGGSSLTLTGALSSSATSATMTATWAYPTVTQLVNFSNGNQRSVLFTNGSAALSWADGLTAAATTAISSIGVQYYRVPSNISKVKDFTVSVGQLTFTPLPVNTRAEWDLLNFLPYTSDIPQRFFIYNGQLGIFPTPSSTGNIMTFNYQTRVADLSIADVSDGTIAAAGMVAGSTAVTGLGTAWITTDAFPANVDLSYMNLMIAATPPNGDGIWYPISRFLTGTTLTLQNPVINAPNITATTAYTIGQFPLLQEDFHDMLVYGALKVYFSTIKVDKARFSFFDNLFASRLSLLEDYAGTKQVNVDLGAEINPVNPNIFLYASS